LRCTWISSPMTGSHLTPLASFDCRPAEPGSAEG